MFLERDLFTYLFMYLFIVFFQSFKYPIYWNQWDLTCRRLYRDKPVSKLNHSN